MKTMFILICLIALGFLLALVAYDDSTRLSAELESVMAELGPLKATLGETESERDNLKVKADAERQNNEQLQKKVNELTGSCEQLQKQLDKLTFLSDQSRQQLAEIIDTRDKLKEQVVELTGSRDKLRQQNDELATSNSQLSKQVKELIVSRDEAITEAETARKRIEVLVAMMDSGKQEPGRRQDDKVLTNQVQGGKEPTMVEISEQPAAVTEVNRPAVVPDRLSARPTCHCFNTTRSRITPGQTSILSWQIANAGRIRIEPGIGPVSALGSIAVKPSTATTYTLIATNKAGESRVKCRIEVGDSPAVQ